MRVKLYIDVLPHKRELNHVADVILNYLGPAVPDRSGWGLMRPGLLTPTLVRGVCLLWGAKPREVPPSGIQLRGDWVIFDYLFSRPVMASPVGRCLDALGLARMEPGASRLPNTYLATVGLNVEDGCLVMLYTGRGRKVEADLDTLAYVIAHMFGCQEAVRRVFFNVRFLAYVASRLYESPFWRLELWRTLEGQDITQELLQKRPEEVTEMIKSGSWRTLEFASPHGRIRLHNPARRKEKAIIISMKKRDYRPGPMRKVERVFDALWRASKGIVDRARKVSLELPKTDDAGILRAYTERRGIMAVLAREGPRARDVSYEFLGYDVEVGHPLKYIEVKAFRDTGDKTVRLTEHEYEVMCSDDKGPDYWLYVVEEAWEEKPRVNMIREPRRLPFRKHDKQVLHISSGTETIYECGERDWRAFCEEDS